MLMLGQQPFAQIKSLLQLSGNLPALAWFLVADIGFIEISLLNK